MNRLLHSRAVLCALGGMLSLAIVLAVFLSGILAQPSLSLSDALYRPAQAPADIVVLAVDDRSLQDIGRWPWDRNIWADVITRLQDASVIGFDISFFERSDDDEALASAINASRPPVILASEFGFHDGISYLKPVFPTVAGHVNLQPDADGTIRTLPTRLEDVPSFSAMIAEAHSGPHALPPRVLLPFSANPRVISVTDILHDKAAIPQGAIVLIGVTAPDFHDDHFTPLSKAAKTPGVLIHASAIAAIEREQYLQRQSRQEVILVIVALCTLGALLFWLLPMGFSGIITLLLGGAYAVWAWYAFSGGLIADILHPLLASILVVGICNLSHYLLERNHKRWVADIFGRFVSKEVADEIMSSMHHGADIGLRGKKVPLSIMFSDIRGFTSLSEAVTPEQLISLLNEYLTAMSAVIMHERGVVDKYIGDAIMAFWNAPLREDSHALLACKAALSMVKRLETLQDEWKERKLPLIECGIGINTGDAIVGTMGSTERLSYTAIGDNVNLASRLEGLTKEYGVRIIISETTHHTIKGAMVCRKLDVVRVKGKSKPVAIYEVVGETVSEAQQRFIHAYEDAFELYRIGKFKEAKKSFGMVFKLRNDKSASLMLERCQELEKDPPREWDGVHVMTHK